TALTNRLKANAKASFSSATLLGVQNLTADFDITRDSIGLRFTIFGQVRRDGRDIYMPNEPDEPISWRSIPVGDRDKMRILVDYRLWEGMASVALERCILFPAERIAVNIFAKELELNRFNLVDRIANDELDGRDVAEIVKKKVGRYPWPVRDS